MGLEVLRQIFITIDQVGDDIDYTVTVFDTVAHILNDQTRIAALTKSPGYFAFHKNAESTGVLEVCDRLLALIARRNIVVVGTGTAGELARIAAITKISDFVGEFVLWILNSGLLLFIKYI